MSKESNKKNYRILIVDDDVSFHKDIRQAPAFLQHYEFEKAYDAQTLDKFLKSSAQFDLMVLDLVLEPTREHEMPEKIKEKVETGLTRIKKIRAAWPNTPIVVATNHNILSIADKAINLGADAFLYKPEYKPEEWEKRFRKVIEDRALARENEELKQQFTPIQPPIAPFLGVSPQIETIRQMLKVVADRPDLTVLITGETGVGKGVAARFLHYNSQTRRDKPFVTVDISNITESLRESELFGAMKGAYTDAKSDKKGRLQIADGGILFLDEIGELDKETQAKLLQFVQTKTIRPMGAEMDIQLDVHIVAATNKVLKDEVKNGNFRLDLYQRLKVFPIEIPPLRDRREDIEILLEHFLNTKSREFDKVFEPDVKHLLLKYDWVGNVRELENTVLSMKIQQEVRGLSRITFECLPEEIQELKRITQPVFHITSLHAVQADALARDREAISDVNEQQSLIMLQAIEKALIKKNGVKNDVAAELGWKSSDLVRYRIKTIHEKFPHLLSHFPEIRRRYKKLFA